MISPLLTNMELVKCVSVRSGTSVYIVKSTKSNQSYYLKHICIPESQKQVDALMFTGAAATVEDAQNYYKQVAADYLADPDVKASIDAEIENQTDDSMTIKVYADGNALVYEYQFTDEYDLSDEDIKQSVLDALKEGCEENASTFEDIADTLESEVGLSGVHVRLVYLNGDGSEIYTHDFE
ncbi:MAG: hypothetical protein BHW36_12150 [Firmicutes bacterium CAG:24053_14]|nr:MAG: hypothetical protein BHW36_12150 [Firmicutes bacterium CAG:24053_14]